MPYCRDGIHVVRYTLSFNVKYAFLIYSLHRLLSEDDTFTVAMYWLPCPVTTGYQRLSVAQGS